jgi:hypothetical protein
MIDEKNIIRVDAKTFQDALGELAATMVQKLFREGPEHIRGPEYIREGHRYPDQVRAKARPAGATYALFRAIFHITKK